MLKEGREGGRDGSEAGIFGIGMWWSLVELREGGREGEREGGREGEGLLLGEGRTVHREMMMMKSHIII